MPDTWFISDTHFGHANIIGYCRRPFSSAEEMDEAMIANWNRRVRPGDTVYHLGDFAWWRQREATSVAAFNRLSGSKCLVLGNHDDAKAMAKLGWQWVKPVHELRLGRRQSIWLSHYAHRVWPKSHHGAWHLYGHSHGRLPPYGLSCDVGVDCWDYAPVHMEEIGEAMRRQTLPAESEADGRQ
jgi:calcineurin-like phosphoesterase family protein